MPRLLEIDDRVSDICRAIRHLVLTGGIHSLTMRAISREVGISVGTLSDHFPSKRHLVRVAARRIGAAWNEDLAWRCRARGPVGLVPADGEELDEVRVWIAFTALGLVDDWVADAVAAIEDAQRDLLITGAADTTVDLSLVWSLVQGLRLQRCRSEEALSYPEAAEILGRVVPVVKVDETETDVAR